MFPLVAGQPPVRPASDTAASRQDHEGMLPLHHAASNSGSSAGGIVGRLLANFIAGAQACRQMVDAHSLSVDYYIRVQSLYEGLNSSAEG